MGFGGLCQAFGQACRQCQLLKRLKHIESLFYIEIKIEITIGIESAGIIVVFDFDSDDLYWQRIP